MLNLKGFTYEPDNFEGLYKISDDLRRNKLQEQQQQEKDLAQKNANAKYFGNLLDKKDYLTGTNYDPATNHLLDQAFSQAMDLSSKGASVDQILMATQPLMSKVNDYMGKAKMYSAQKAQALEHFKATGGYDLGKISDLLDKYTFFDDNGNLNVDNADPSLKTAIQKIDDNDLADVATSAGINKWADKFPKEDRQDNIVTTDAHGNKKISKLNVKAASWEVPEHDASGNIVFVPKHDIATDNKQPVIHTFSNPDGTTTQAPVRLLDKNVFQNLITSDQSAADYIKGNLLKVIKTGEFKDDNGNPISINSPKADMVARALAYDFLKGRTGGVVSQASQQLVSPYQIKLNLGVPLSKQSGGSGDGSANVNDIYGRIKDKVYNNADSGYITRFNSLDGDEQSVVLDFANKGKTEASKLDGSNVFLRKNSNGNVEVYKISDNGELLAEPQYLVTTLPKVGTNLKVQPSVREKREVINNSKGETHKSNHNDPLGILD